MESKNDIQFQSLTDYTSRATKYYSLRGDYVLNDLKNKALEKLINIAKTILPNVALSSPKNFQYAIDHFEKEYQQEDNSERKSHLKSILSLLKNIDKISKLEVITIPDEQGISSTFCTMAESAGGVTEKISVTPRDDVFAKLKYIVNEDNSSQSTLTYDNFKRYTSEGELRTKGILKLPKHGKTTEVQREAIALNISRILNFTTAQSTMVNHNGKAALYVPFDNIQLIKEFAQGETQKVIIPSGLTKLGTIGDTYLHHSTITPVGNGLNCDSTLSDFGDKIAFSFLCNDTDFVGAYNQNKAIIGGKDLYIFDQVIMSKNKMDFDTRLSMIPMGVNRHSRHNQGRNRSLIEDSSFDRKFDGVLDLLNKKDEINLMMDNIIGTHDNNIKSTEKAINELNPKSDKEKLTFLNAQKQELVKLKADAETIKETINNRFTDLFKNFPSINKAPMTAQSFVEKQAQIRPALQLEKLVNNPVLFAEDGRPFRHPWTTRNSIQITAIEEDEKTGEMHLSFSKFNPEHLGKILQSANVNLNACAKVNGNTLIIPKSELEKINENSIFPERNSFSMDNKYLDMNSIMLMSAGYSDNNRTYALTKIC